MEKVSKIPLIALVAIIIGLAAIAPVIPNAEAVTRGSSHGIRIDCETDDSFSCSTYAPKGIAHVSLASPVGAIGSLFPCEIPTVFDPEISLPNADGNWRITVDDCNGHYSSFNAVVSGGKITSLVWDK